MRFRGRFAFAQFGSRAVRHAARFPIDNLTGSLHDAQVQRSLSHRSLLIPHETRAAYALRKRRLARLDWLLWRIETHNWIEDPDAPAPWSLISAAMRLGCHVRWPSTGAMLHGAVLDRQDDVVRPVYMVLHNSLRDEEGRIPRVSPLGTESLEEIA